LRRRRRDQGRVIIAAAEDAQRAEVLAAAYRTALRDLLIADRSRVDTVPLRDGQYLVSVTYVPEPA
jgi:DNA-binding transcriptional regulator LsrR (DeoR family)